MELYPFQKKIFNECLEFLKVEKSLIVVIPTGGGKTVIFSHLVKYLNKKTIIIAHTQELILQARKTLQKVGTKNCDVLSVQKCHRQLESLNDYEILIIDECHRSMANSYLKIIDKFKDKIIIGVTATPFRNDEKLLSTIYQKKVAPLSLIDMIENGFLCDFIGYRIKTQCTLKGISTKNGDFVSSKLSSVINVKNRNELIVEQYKKIALDEKTICFAANIQHCDELSKEFNKNGITAQSIHGKTPKEKRSKIIEEFKEGKIKVIISCQLLTEGFDEPSITCLLMARPTTSKILYMQMIGRGSRIFKDKKHCKVIEFTDNEYDVTSIEEILDLPTKKYRIKPEEKLTDYYKRTKAVLLEEAKEVVVEKMVLIPKTIYERSATKWQLEFLIKNKIKHRAHITEFEANQLISGIDNGINM